jgi:hypothetical protein
MEKNNQERKYQKWQVNFIHGYLGSISNAARNRICRDEKHLFIKGLTTDDWKYFIEGRITTLNTKSDVKKIRDCGIKWIRIKTEA